MKYLEIGKTYNLKNGEKVILKGGTCEIDRHVEYPMIIPIVRYSVLREYGGICEVWESDFDFEEE